MSLSTLFLPQFPRALDNAASTPFLHNFNHSLLTVFLETPNFSAADLEIPEDSRLSFL